jgi:hypothetical protein
MPFKEIGKSKAVCTDADRKLEAEVNARLKHGRVSAYSIPGDDGTTTYGLILTHMGKSNQSEQDRPFIADEIVAKAEATAPELAAMARPAWTGEIGWKPATRSPPIGDQED